MLVKEVLGLVGLHLLQELHVGVKERLGRVGGNHDLLPQHVDLLDTVLVDTRDIFEVWAKEFHFLECFYVRVLDDPLCVIDITSMLEEDLDEFVLDADNL